MFLMACVFRVLFHASTAPLMRPLALLALMEPSYLMPAAFRASILA